MGSSEISSSIEELAKSLKLPTTRQNFRELAKDAASKNMDYMEYLYRLLQMEYDARSNNAIKNRIRRAQFTLKNI